ncbi:S locus-related glycoprotein 1 binding pollen coat protein [Arabidopsis thaliana x Arabidopsis arenosa]|uniref:S locus-related glycoprotein 1 binding pollen coat protein n=2 Tax=Arabidopsis TaxID=3701 RepID=A0A8T2F783_ARASU|nr:S locus-related glycoprotein 1 binding pollen coat protein [Arabidopsis thaliana x Arabidopsis arenosa]KAG7632027.1 S locus-related glycoprotein 1 binding pollen coat protein [Arabidopsis suecica]
MTQKATILAIFMVVLVLGMETKETQGQEMCHDLIKKTDCDDATCVTLCKQKWNGNGGGSCFQIVNLKSCLCAFPCQV